MTEHSTSPASAPLPATEHKNYFLDQEFIEDGKTIQLIQIGLVCDDGREYEAISSEYDYGSASDWVKEHVIQPLFLKTMERARTEACPYRVQQVNGIFYLMDGDSMTVSVKAEDFNKVYGKSRVQITVEVAQFIGCELVKDQEKGLQNAKLVLPAHLKVRFWGYYADYDWVLFCSLFGRMIDLPEGLPMYCRDLKQELDRLAENVYPEVSTKEAIERLKTWEGWPVQKPGEEHDAVNDARWNKALFDFMVNINFLNREREPKNLLGKIAAAINQCNAEKQSDTPDYLLANYLVGCLNNYSRTVKARDEWRRQHQLSVLLSPDEEQLILDVRKAKASPINQVAVTQKISDEVDRAAGKQPVGGNLFKGLPRLSYEQLEQKMAEQIFGNEGDMIFAVRPANEQQLWYMQHPAPKFYPTEKVDVPVKEGDHRDSFIRKQRPGDYEVKGLQWSETRGWCYLLEFKVPGEEGIHQRWVPEGRIAKLGTAEWDGQKPWMDFDAWKREEKKDWNDPLPREANPPEGYGHTRKEDIPH